MQIESLGVSIFGLLPSFFQLHCLILSIEALDQVMEVFDIMDLICAACASVSCTYM